MALSFGYELFEGYPVPEDGVSFGATSVNNVTPLLEINGLVVGASLNFDTLTITLKGVPVESPPFPDIPVEDFGVYSFEFRGDTYTVVSTSRGPKIRVGNTWIYISWSCTGIRTDALKLSIG